MNRIQSLKQEGQSVWLDYIERSMLKSGELSRLIDAGVAGVTSNPSIFQGAITSSDAYVDDLHSLLAQGLTDKDIFEVLAVADIQAAADLLRPLYDKSEARDGFVSLEVAPDLAYATDATVAEAKRLHAMVARPNLLIKVPATVEGIPAISSLIAAGINVNVTLIFGLERYAAVKEAYLQGLEARVEAGEPIDHIASVASFFVSRVDGKVDARLAKLAADDMGNVEDYRALQGRIAVANAKLAYRQFQEKFVGERWNVLANQGAQVQRPLWASTSTKNPEYPDLLYVDTLIGPHTVNTMPPATLAAFRDHGTITRTVDADIDRARRDIAALAATGIAMDQVTDELEAEGVQKFADSYQELLDAIGSRRAKLLATG